jgi:hypothetical protein
MKNNTTRRPCLARVSGPSLEAFHLSQHWFEYSLTKPHQFRFLTHFVFTGPFYAVAISLITSLLKIVAGQFAFIPLSAHMGKALYIFKVRQGGCGDIANEDGWGVNFWVSPMLCSRAGSIL